jgi:dipeptide transport system substrate-binding protein
MDQQRDELLYSNVKGKNPFKDKRVRQALYQAIDIETIRSTTMRGLSKPTGAMLPAPLPWIVEPEKRYPFDRAKAKRLLAEAGYPNGFTTDLWAMPVQRPYNPNARRIAELMQSDLAKIGVTAEIKSFEWGEDRKRMQNGEHQMGMLGWTGDNGDPDNFLNTLLGCDAAKTNGSNVSKWCYQPFEELVQKAKTISDQKQRADLYSKAQVVFKEQAPWFTIAHAVQLKPVRKEVIDYKLSPFGRHTFYGVDIKEP